MNGQPFTASDVAMLRRLYPHTGNAALAKGMGRTIDAINAVASRLGIKKSAEYLAAMLGNPSRASFATRFQKGHVPANKGLRRPSWAPGRMAETQFKKGSYPPRWDREQYAVGALRLNADGIVDMKFKEGPHAWRALHVILWEDANGPLPKGYCLRFKDDDHLNIELDNLEIITRAENLRRNSIQRYPPALRSAIVALGQFKRRIRERSEIRA